MNLRRPLPLAVLWLTSLVVTVACTHAWLGTDFTGQTGDNMNLAKNPSATSGVRTPHRDSTDAPAATQDALRASDPLARVAGIAEMLPHLSEKNALDVLDAYRGIRKEKGGGMATEGELIMLQVGRAAGLAALERDRPQDPASPKVPAQFDLVMRGFAGTDPTGALNYWRNLPDGPFKNSLKSGLLTGMAENNTAMARDFFASLPPSEQLGQISNLANQINRQEGSKALQDWFVKVPEDPRDATVKWTTFHAVGLELQESPAANADFMAREASKPYAANDIYNPYAIAFTDAAPTAALDWATGLPAPEGTTLRSEILTTVISRWTAHDSGAVGDWLNSNAGSPNYDEVAAGYAQQLSLLDPSAASRWISTIRNVELRATISDRLGGSVAVAH